MTQYCQETKYPSIYKNSYWGRHRYNPQNPIHEKIIFNRNEFIEKNNITSFVKTLSQSIRVRLLVHNCEIIDHRGNKIPITMKNAHKHYSEEIFRDNSEEYKCGNLVFSFFSTHTTDAEHERIIKSGYQEYKPMYSIRMKTYLKIITRIVKRKNLRVISRKKHIASEFVENEQTNGSFCDYENI